MSSSEHQFQSVLQIVLCSIYTHERTGSSNRPWLIRRTVYRGYFGPKIWNYEIPHWL